jgi:hypothetical protein
VRERMSERRTVISARKQSSAWANANDCGIEKMPSCSGVVCEQSELACVL